MPELTLRPTHRTSGCRSSRSGLRTELGCL